MLGSTRFLGSIGLMVFAWAMLGTSCPRNPLAGARVPRIFDVVPGEGPEQGAWLAADSTKFLTVQVKNLAQSATGVRVTIMMSRHRPWNGTGESREWSVPTFIIADSDPETQQLSARFVPPHPEEFRETQLVFFRWFVITTQPDGNDLVLAESPLRSFRIGGFTRADTDAALLAAQGAIVAQHDFTRDAVSSDPMMHDLLPTHPHMSGSRCFERMGMAYAPPCVLSNSCPIGLTTPTLLLYTPAPASPLPFGGSRPEWRLVGWAYAGPHNGTIGAHPIIPNIPWESWFVHEAGFHTADGGFRPTPPADDSPRGSTLATPPGIGAPNWHGRKWDLHVFARRGGVPLVAIGDPTLPSGGGCVAWDSSSFFDVPDLDVQPSP